MSFRSEQESQTHSSACPASVPEKEPATLLFRVKTHSCPLRVYNNSPQKQSSPYILRGYIPGTTVEGVSVMPGWDFWKVEAGLYIFKNWQFMKMRAVKTPADGMRGVRAQLRVGCAAAVCEDGL